MTSDPENLGQSFIRSPGLPELLPFSRMEEIAASGPGEYVSAEPYPHIVIDGFFDELVLNAVLAEFPGPKDTIWGLHDWPEEIKLHSKHERDIPPFARQFLYALNSASFLEFLERLTGIQKLIGDPYFEGGGLHQIMPGGKLAIHADFNKHGTYELSRRLNLLVYLNKYWKDEFGGHFELWDRGMTRMVKRVAPIFNRIVIFTTSRYSYHGHPDPLTCPRDMTRKSLALYYYIIGGEEAGQEDPRHTTLFQMRPGERRARQNARQILRDLVPPLLWRAASRVVRFPGG
ncbi:MAG: 2OG-Fe(II) oxygenase [Methylocella sp.]